MRAKPARSPAHTCSAPARTRLLCCCASTIWARNRVDDVRYGATRTYQVDEVVGHDDGAGTPTHFTALNLNRQVMIIEIPGGDASKTRTLTGPYLFGAGEDKTPVLLRFDDLGSQPRRRCALRRDADIPGGRGGRP